MAEQFMPIMKEECPISVNTQTSHCYDIILDEDIHEPSYYRNAFQVLRDAQEGDLIRIFICSNGGSLASAIQFKNYIEDCNGHVIAVVDGYAYSAASMIALCAHEIHVKPYSTWMLHSASFGAIGNTENVKAQVDFTAKHADAFMEEVYDGFVTPEEMEDIRRGVEIWLDADQVNQRLEKKFSSLMEDCGVQEHKTLEQMIQESVVTAVDEAMKNVLKRFDLSPKAPKQKAKKAIDTLIVE
jgi:ATP-dependent protease ClpP protease subunit